LAFIDFRPFTALCPIIIGLWLKSCCNRTSSLRGGFACNDPAHAAGAVTFFASPKKVTQKRRPRRLAYSCDAQKKAERKKLAIAQTVFRSDRFFLPLLGANQRGPIKPMLERTVNAKGKRRRPARWMPGECTDVPRRCLSA
jgi:hypothetical protein